MDQVAQNILSIYDKNKNNTIDMDEAQKLIGDLLRSAGLNINGQHILTLFKAHDKDGNNRLDAEEIKKLIAEVTGKQQ